MSGKSDAANNVSRESFMRLCDTLIDVHSAAKFELVKQPTFMKLWCLATFTSPSFTKLSRVVSSSSFEHVMLGVVFVNIVSILAKIDLEYDPDEEGFTFIELVELGFTLCYTAEMVLKLLVFGARPYWSKYSNRFDAVTTLGALGAEIYVLIAGAVRAEETVRPRLRLTGIYQCATCSCQHSER
eukprot:COSAG01_NODE_22267_length_863_cov_1.666230_1_plen_184_part_00